MPLKSKAEMRFLFAKKPAIAREFAAKTPNIADLPDRVAGDDPDPDAEQAADQGKRYSGLSRRKFTGVGRKTGGSYGK